MRRCPQCFKDLGDWRYCTNCGRSVANEVQSGTYLPLRTGHTRCPDCGKRVVGVYCSNCGRQLREYHLKVQKPVGFEQIKERLKLLFGK